jgi:hypothetical protein
MKLISLLFIIIVFSCTNNTNQQKIMTDSSSNTLIVGNDADEHGCKSSAGYTWSIMKNDCIRLWETGIQLKPIENKESYTSIATVVLNNDSTKAELFIATEKISVLLDKQNGAFLRGNGYVFLKVNEKWILKKDNKSIYQE